MISFNVPPVVGNELGFIAEAVENRRISGDGDFTKRCSRLMEKRFDARHVLIV